MRAHAQPHLRADLPAYISSCHTHSGSLTNWLSTEDVQRLHQVRQPLSFLTRLQASIFILLCTLAGTAARRSPLNRSCIPGPRQASRWPRGSAAAAYRITSRVPGHGSFISKRPSGTTRVCFPTSAPRLSAGPPPAGPGRVSRSGTRDPSPPRGPAPYCRRAPAVQPSPPQWPWGSPGDIPRGFFLRPSFRLFHCSPLGAAERSDGSVRLGLDLSSPRVASVIWAFSAMSCGTLCLPWLRPRLPPLPCAARGLAAPALHVGRERSIRRPPAPLWGPLFPLLFTPFAGALPWIAVHVRGCTRVLHSLDGYFLARDTHAACARALQAFRDLCRDLGVPLASEQLVLPPRCLQFLGVTLDSSLLEMRLPPERLARLRDCLPAWRTRQ